MNAPDMAAAALDLAAAGWSVFPCKWHVYGDDAKAPLTDHGHKDASRDPDFIRSWWRRWPLAMIGAPVPDSMLVIDIDPRNGGSLDALTEAAGVPMPDTLTAWSGRNDRGRHMYFLRPAGRLTSTRLPAGIDLKVNGYCIVPPSLHPVSMRPYWWDQRQAVALPPRLRDLLRPPVAPPRVFRRSGRGNGAALVSFVGKFVMDGVNDALYWAARRAAEDGILADIEADLVDVAVQVGGSPRRARATVDSARKAHAEGGAR